MRVLIVGNGQERGSLAAARSLASSGWIVGAGTPGGRGLLAHSRAVSQHHDIPLVSSTDDVFIRAVRAAIQDDRYDLVFSSSDAELLVLSESRDDLGAIFPYPSDASLRRVLDKGQLDELGRGVGFSVPEAFEVLNDDGLDGIEYPIVIKDRLHSPRRGGGLHRVEALAVRDASEARRVFEQVRSDGGEPIAQRFIAGDLMAYVCLIDPRGTVVADCQQIADAIWPHPAGVSTRAQTVQVDEAIAARSTALLNGLGWQGLAEVQFVQPPGQDPYLIDVNARFYGSIALAIAAGVDFPALWADLAVKRHVARVRARPGVRYQWIEGDLRRSWALGGKLRVPALFTAVGASGRSAHSIWSVRDPIPGVRHSIELMRRAAGKSNPWT